MYSTRFCWMVAAALAVAALAAVPGGPAMAKPPAPVVRTFGFYSFQVDPELVPDFEDEDSVVVVVQRDTGAVETIQFADCDCNGALRNTVWKFRPVKHVTKGAGSDEGPFFWLQTEECPDLPDAGAVARTGPDGAILSQTVYRIRLCEAYPDCGYYDQGTKWRVDDSNGVPFVVVTAEFNK